MYFFFFLHVPIHSFIKSVISAFICFISLLLSLSNLIDLKDIQAINILHLVFVLHYTLARQSSYRCFLY